jgi:hypothetical protein
MIEILLYWILTTVLGALFYLHETRPGHILNWYMRLIDLIPEKYDYFWKILGGCYLCFFTQIHLWGGVVFMYLRNEYTWLIVPSLFLNYFLMLVICYYWGPPPPSSASTTPPNLPPIIPHDKFISDDEPYQYDIEDKSIDCR